MVCGPQPTFYECPCEQAQHFKAAEHRNLAPEFRDSDFSQKYPDSNQTAFSQKAKVLKRLVHERKVLLQTRLMLP